MKIERIWAMPNHNTFSIKPIREFIGEVPIQSIDAFARNSDLATITNDLNPDFDTTHNMDALDFLKTIDDNWADMVLFDPPYSPRQLKECYDSIGKSLTQSQEKTAIKHPHVLGMGEVFSWTKVTSRETKTMKSLSTMLEHDCIINGHTAGASGKNSMRIFHLEFFLVMSQLILNKS